MQNYTKIFIYHINNSRYPVKMSRYPYTTSVTIPLLHVTGNNNSTLKHHYITNFITTFPQLFVYLLFILHKLNLN